MWRTCSLYSVYRTNNLVQCWVSVTDDVSTSFQYWFNVSSLLDNHLGHSPAVVVSTTVCHARALCIQGQLYRLSRQSSLYSGSALPSVTPELSVFRVSSTVCHARALCIQGQLYRLSRQSSLYSGSAIPSVTQELSRYTGLNPPPPHNYGCSTIT